MTLQTPIRRTAGNRLRSADQRGFYADIRETGDAPNVTTEIRIAPVVPVHIAKYFGPDHAALARVRHMAAGDRPLQIATSYLPVSVVDAVPILAELDTGPGGMYQRLEEAGHPLAQIDIVGGRPATDDETEALVLDIPFVITIVRVTRDARTEQILEIGDLVLATGRQELVYDI